MDCNRRIGVIGLGYVGLPLALEFCRRGFEVWGVDCSADRVALLQKNKSYIGDVSAEAVAECVESGRFYCSTEYTHLANVGTMSICVPTPLRKTRDPDLSYVVDAAEHVADILQKGQTVILESTVYPGATEEVIAPILERSGLKAGTGFFLAFSPERVDPGNKAYGIGDIPKVVGGITPESTERAVRAYSQVFKKIIPVSAREAEMAKLLENTFRAVNIGLINELALVAHKMGISIWNVIDAAKSKPFGFSSFYPGPGLGGHCIPIDPLYLSWKAKSYHADTGFIELADKVNGQMPRYVVERLADLLNGEGKPIKDSRILVLGVAYKPDVNDVREAPALDIIGLLNEKGARVTYNDPHVGELDYLGKVWASAPLTDGTLAKQDCVVIVTNHTAYDWRFILEHSRLVFDTRNACKGISPLPDKLHLL